MGEERERDVKSPRGRGWLEWGSSQGDVQEEENKLLTLAGGKLWEGEVKVTYASCGRRGEECTQADIARKKAAQRFFLRASCSL